MPDEIGGEFDWEWPSPCEKQMFPWPEGAAFYSSARSALLAICRFVGAPSCRLFVPEYFCSEVVESLCTAGLRIAVYRDTPDQPSPDLESLRANTGDIVLAVNFFGVRTFAAWSAWRLANRETVLIEDHTHDPWSSWALSSEADYAIASVRKTLPVPDGAIAWSPRMLPVPQPAIILNAPRSFAQIFLPSRS